MLLLNYAHVAPAPIAAAVRRIDNERLVQSAQRPLRHLRVCQTPTRLSSEHCVAVSKIVEVFREVQERAK